MNTKDEEGNQCAMYCVQQERKRIGLQIICSQLMRSDEDGLFTDDRFKSITPTAH